MTPSTQRVELEEIREEIADLDTPQDRLAYLIELGQALPDLPERYQIEDFRVLGCQSMVWVVPNLGENRIDFIGSSDAPMVRGLVSTAHVCPLCTPRPSLNAVRVCCLPALTTADPDSAQTLQPVSTAGAVGAQQKHQDVWRRQQQQRWQQQQGKDEACGRGFATGSRPRQHPGHP